MLSVLPVSNAGLIRPPPHRNPASPRNRDDNEAVLSRGSFVVIPIVPSTKLNGEHRGDILWSRASNFFFEGRPCAIINIDVQQTVS